MLQNNRHPFNPMSTYSHGNASGHFKLFQSASTSFISIMSYTKENALKEELNIWPENTGYNTFTGKIPVGQLLPLHISVYQKLRELISACGMHNFDANEKFGDGIGPYEYWR